MRQNRKRTLKNLLLSKKVLLGCVGIGAVVIFYIVMSSGSSASNARSNKEEVSVKWENDLPHPKFNNIPTYKDSKMNLIPEPKSNYEQPDNYGNIPSIPEEDEDETASGYEKKSESIEIFEESPKDGIDLRNSIGNDEFINPSTEYRAEDSKVEQKEQMKKVTKDPAIKEISKKSSTSSQSMMKSGNEATTTEKEKTITKDPVMKETSEKSSSQSMMISGNETSTQHKNMPLEVENMVNLKNSTEKHSSQMMRKSDNITVSSTASSSRASESDLENGNFDEPISKNNKTKINNMQTKKNSNITAVGPDLKTLLKEVRTMKGQLNATQVMQNQNPAKKPATVGINTTLSSNNSSPKRNTELGDLTTINLKPVVANDSKNGSVLEKSSRQTNKPAE